MNYWLVKADPADYGYDDLERDGRTVWDGIRNNQALLFLRDMKKGDRVFFYHSGKEKRMVAMADVVRGPYADPAELDERWVVVDLKAGRRLGTPVTLAAIKADPRFAQLGLVRMSRLSVMPVPPDLGKVLEAMGDG